MKQLLLLLVFSFVVECNFAQTQRKVAVLDMSLYNPTAGASRNLSAIRTMRMIGAPYDVTTSLEDALNYPIILTGSRIEQSSFSSTQQVLLKNYVNNGGVLITSCLRDTTLYAMCGISTMNTFDKYFKITFDTLAAPLFNWIDDSMEVTISLGNPSNTSSFYTQYYGLSTALPLAKYDDGKNAIVKNNYGNGTTYLFGPDFRDIIYRNQIDFDASAQRAYSNGFEPTTDVIFMLIRNIIRKHLPNTVFKHTIPGTSVSTLMITHDVDSRTAMDTMQPFSDYERMNGINAMYNITTHYFHDTWMTNFYIGSWSKVHTLIQDGHTISSHSVGHFPDFDNETLFPFGTIGNTPGNYAPYYSGGVTTGGTVLGELEVSKFLLENDHSVPIKSFRAGHLAYNDKLILGLDSLGYEFNSTFSANNVLTSYPYYGVLERTYNGIESSVLEIPMTISDVFNDISENNYLSKVDIWTDVTYRYAKNHSPITLLIHPNRNYKLLAEIEYLNRLPASTSITNMEEYGRFWRKRDSLNFYTEINGSALSVHFNNEELRFDQSFIVDFAGLDTLYFYDKDGLSVRFDWIPWDYGTRLYYQIDPNLTVTENQQKFQKILIYPNPTTDIIALRLPHDFSNSTIEIFNQQGLLVFSKCALEGELDLSLNSMHLKSGVYFVRAANKSKVLTEKIILLNQ